ncbi:MAG: mechanosensitive ion channel family protein [Firmicutes bacterium]|nr:mechanosensitive ion channel family protein [Bacillota bacterium]
MQTIPPDFKKLGRQTWILVLVLILLGIAMAVGLDLSHQRLGINKNYLHLIKAFIVLVVGGLISYLLERYLFRMAPSAGGRTSSLRFVVRLILLLVVVLSILAAFGVGLSSVVFGGAFFTVIIGLAGQTMFGNLIAGIGLVIFRPFDVGNHVTFVAWQYPMLMPSYPHDALKPGYSGVITDINLMYTAIRSDQGLPMMIPNGILIQAMIENHSRSEGHRIRFRFDLPLATPAEAVIDAIRQILQQLHYQGDAFLVDVSPSSYSVAVAINSLEAMATDDTIRDQILSRLVPQITGLSAQGPPQ